MKRELGAVGAVLLAIGTPAGAHRLDEYLQATLISVEKTRIHGQIRLTPGVAVAPVILADIASDADGVISEPEQRAYAERVLRDLSLTIDGGRLRLRIVSGKFAEIEEMKEGRGEIQIDFDAEVPAGGPNRKLRFENHHESWIAAYLVNCLVPRDPDIRLITQNRNYSQSYYQVDYVQAGVYSRPLSLAWWFGLRGWVGAAALVVVARLGLRWRHRAGQPRPAPVESTGL